MLLGQRHNFQARLNSGTFRSIKCYNYSPVLSKLTKPVICLGIAHLRICALWPSPLKSTVEGVEIHYFQYSLSLYKCLLLSWNQHNLLPRTHISSLYSRTFLYLLDPIGKAYYSHNQNYYIFSLTLYRRDEAEQTLYLHLGDVHLLLCLHLCQLIK